MVPEASLSDPFTSNGRNILRSLTLAYGQMILRSGFFHADPHPGNILICRGSQASAYPPLSTLCFAIIFLVHLIIFLIFMYYHINSLDDIVLCYCFIRLHCLIMGKWRISLRNWGSDMLISFLPSQIMILQRHQKATGAKVFIGILLSIDMSIIHLNQSFQPVKRI